MIEISEDLPICAYKHRDADAHDKKLVRLMRMWEKSPRNVALIKSVYQARKAKGEEQISALLLEYAYEIAGDSEREWIDKILTES